MELNRHWHLAASVLALTAVYFCAGKLGLSWAYVHPSASAVWPPSGIALAALLLWGSKLWPGIFLGAFLVNITTYGSAATSCGIAIGNTLEALVAVWGINRFANGAKSLERARTTFKFVLIAAGLSTTASATLGLTSLTVAGLARWENFPAIWLTWWLGDAVGNLIVAPLILIWLTQPYPRFNAERIIEALGLLLALTLPGYYIFAREPFTTEYILLLPLLWAAFRFGQRGAVTAAFLVSGIALAGTMTGGAVRAGQPQPIPALSTNVHRTGCARSVGPRLRHFREPARRATTSDAGRDQQDFGWVSRPQRRLR